jgi:polyferredoxin
MGIDIRHSSHQLECIHCGECIDACSAILGRLGRESLIHYAWGDAGQNVSRDRSWYRRLGLRDGKRIAVLLLLLFYASGLSIAINIRQPVLVRIMPDRITLYSVDSAGMIHNRFRLVASNRGQKEAMLSLSLEDLPSARIEGMEKGMESGVVLKPGESLQREFDIVAAVTGVAPGVNHLRILTHVVPAQKDDAVAETFIAPMGTASGVESSGKRR